MNARSELFITQIADSVLNSQRENLYHYGL